jgi:hypothetical protein
MPKFFGYKPAGPTRQAVEKFENEITIRHNSQRLVGSVYLDMQDSTWAVAIAYNHSRAPGLHGHENALEVRYSYSPETGNAAQMFRSDPPAVMALDAGQFADPDKFAIYALDHERGIVTHAG